MTTLALKSGQKIQTKLNFVSKKQFDSKFGVLHIVNYVDENGNQFIYKGATPVIDEENGNNISATVKIDSFNGVDSVYIQRIKILSGKTPSQRREEQIEVENKKLDEKAELSLLRREKLKSAVLSFLISEEVLSLIGKDAYFYGWNRDNWGQSSGAITGFNVAEYSIDEIVVLLKTEDKATSFKIHYNNLKELVKNGSFKTNSLLHSGKEGEIR